MDKKFQKTEHGVYLYDDGIDRMSLEEIANIDAKAAEKESAAIEAILKDGYIPFPVFFPSGANLKEAVFYVHPEFTPSCAPNFKAKNGQNFNIYVPSYARAGNTPTTDMLQKFGHTNWYLAIDPSQYRAYKPHYNAKNIIIRDPVFRDSDNIDLLSSIPSPNSYHGTAGIYNSLLYFSKSMGETHYWTIDDDIIGMAMKARKGNNSVVAGEVYDKENYYRCSKIEEEYGFSLKKFLCSIEELTLKTRNPGFVGLEKFGLVFTLPVMWKGGTRVYSFYLTSNKTQVKHFGQHNNDVVTSLELSKNGYVNLLFEGIGYNSGATQAGGGLSEVYAKFGTLDKGKVLIKAHPNYAKISVNYSRIHHNVNYLYYNKQRLVGAVIPR